MTSRITGKRKRERKIETIIDIKDEEEMKCQAESIKDDEIQDVSHLMFSCDSNDPPDESDDYEDND